MPKPDHAGAYTEMLGALETWPHAAYCSPLGLPIRNDSTQDATKATIRMADMNEGMTTKGDTINDAPTGCPVNDADAALLGRITGPGDVKALPESDLDELCRQIRATLIRYGHAHGGHIGSNLGVVELTVALHRVFDSPRDRIIFDVSHQSYVHKMLTGRACAYLDPSRSAQVTGFTNPEESEHDQFVLGHTGTSVSLACGLAKNRDMEGGLGRSGIGNVIAVIGDGSLSSGVAFEGLNNAAEQGGNLIIAVNDNEMSIAGDFGGMYGPLARLRASGGMAQPNLFEAFGLDYRYVEAGNDVHALIAAFEKVRDIDHPVVVHVHTLKGKGLGKAQALADTHRLPADSINDDAANPTAFGGPVTPSTHCRASGGSDVVPAATGNASDDPTAIDTPWHSDQCNLSDHQPHEGQCEASHWQNPDAALGKPDDPRKYYGKLAMRVLEPRFATEPGLVVISPATPGSNGITHEFRERAGAHYVDTGITEQHAVAYAAGIARAGGTPVVCTTASFFQRAYDQFFQEMSLNRARVTILDFLGGLSGADNTHSGAYDIAMWANIPGVTMLAPTNEADYLADLSWATSPASAGDAPEGPVVIRVPGEPILSAQRAGGYPRYSLGDEALHPTDGSAPRPTPPCESGAAAKGNEHADHAGSVVAPACALPCEDMLRWRVTHAGCEVAVIALGNMYPLGEQVTARLAAQYDIDATLIDPRQCTTLDEHTLTMLRDTKHELVVTLEDGQLEGGWGEKVTAWYANHPTDAESPRVLNFGAAKEFTDRVPLAELNKRYGLTVGNLVDVICGVLQ